MEKRKPVLQSQIIGLLNYNANGWLGKGSGKTGVSDNRNVMQNRVRWIRLQASDLLTWVGSQPPDVQSVAARTQHDAYSTHCYQTKYVSTLA